MYNLFKPNIFANLWLFNDELKFFVIHSAFMGECIEPVRCKLCVHWAVSEPQWNCERCFKKQHLKKKWHWNTNGVTKWLLKYHFVIIWLYCLYTTLTPWKTAKLLFLNRKMVKCRRFHTAGVASSKLSSPTKNSQ